MCVQPYSLRLWDRAVKASDRRARATKNRSTLKSTSLPHSRAKSARFAARAPGVRAELYFAIFARLAGVIPLASNTWSPGADSPKSSTPSTFGAERIAWVPWVSFLRRVFLTAGTSNCL